MWVQSKFEVSCAYCDTSPHEAKPGYQVWINQIVALAVHTGKQSRISGFVKVVSAAKGHLQNFLGAVANVYHGCFLSHWFMLVLWYVLHKKEGSGGFQSIHCLSADGFWTLILRMKYAAVHSFKRRKLDNVKSSLCLTKSARKKQEAGSTDLSRRNFNLQMKRCRGSRDSTVYIE